MDVLSALRALDPFDDSQWTTTGLPRLDALGAIMGVDSVSRSDVTAVAPGFTRASRQLPTAEADAPPADATAEAGGAAALGVAERPEDTAAPAGALPPWEDDGPKAADDGLSAQAKRVATLQARMEGLRQQEGALAAFIRETEADLDRAQAELDQVEPPLHEMESIKRWQQAQHEQRARQAEAMQAVRAAAQGLAPISPIDQAFLQARRPTMPPLNPGNGVRK